MTYVCSEVVNNVCQKWVESNSILPPLTMQEGILIGSAIFSLIALTHCFKIVINFVKRI